MAEEFNPYGAEQTLEKGDHFVLVQGLRCYQIFTKEGQQIFGTYDLTAAKNKFNRLELQARESK